MIWDAIVAFFISPPKFWISSGLQFVLSVCSFFLLGNGRRLVRTIEKNTESVNALERRVARLETPLGDKDVSAVNDSQKPRRDTPPKAD